MNWKSLLDLKKGAAILGGSGIAAQLFATGNPVMGGIAGGLAIFFVIWKALGDNRFDKELKDLSKNLEQEKKEKEVLASALKELKECENIGESVNARLGLKEDLAKDVEHLMEKFNNDG